MTTHVLRPSVVMALGVVLGISGCSFGAEKPSPAVTTTPTVTATSTQSSSQLGPAECATVFTDAAVAKLATDGLALQPPLVMHPYWGEFSDVPALPGGFACDWGKPGTDTYVRYAQGSMDWATWEDKHADLVEAGWTESGDFIEGLLASPEGAMPGVVTWRDGVEYIASDATVLSWARTFAE